MTAPNRTPAQLYALIFGVALLAAGVLGLFADATFANVGSDVEGRNFIVFEVNGWHNVVHIASGALGLAVMGSVAAARTYALGFGLVYLGVAIWGFLEGNSVAGLLPVNTADNFLHLIIAAAGIAAGLASPATMGPGSERQAPVAR
ncbi:MAG: DUF4383 domain-containing protein [Actinomycetota bacterium]|nr:DUF4383 domain-containing protein [Actinomycetota bacterium]